MHNVTRRRSADLRMFEVLAKRLGDCWRRSTNRSETPKISND